MCGHTGISVTTAQLSTSQILVRMMHSSLLSLSLSLSLYLAAFDKPDTCAADADDAKNGARLARADGQNGAPLDRHG